MKRELHGIFLLDKPLGGSSNHALQRVKRIFNAAKAGHTGSLDPLATGMLPICFGEATKFSQHLLDANKTYEVTAMLGVRTDTGDAEGQVIDSCRAGTRLAPTHLDVMQILPQFTGVIQQVPPMHSALKHQGRPLYEYARKGETIDRPARTITIFTLELTDWSSSQKTLTLRVHCSKGTYIRSLIDDIGEVLGCGAHVTALRRTLVELFDAYPMISFEELESSIDRDHYLLPIDAALAAWPRQTLNDDLGRQLLRGALITLKASPLPNTPTCFYSEAGKFLGVGDVDQSGQVTNKRLVSMALSGLFL